MPPIIIELPIKVNALLCIYGFVVYSTTFLTTLVLDPTKLPAFSRSKVLRWEETSLVFIGNLDKDQLVLYGVI